MRRRSAKVDLNQAEIVQALQQVGAHIYSLAAVGDGMADLLVSFRGRLFLLEVKAMRGRLTEAQLAFHQKWPVHIVRNVTDALQAIGASR